MSMLDIDPADRAEMDQRANRLGCVYVAARDYFQRAGFWRRVRLHRTARRAHKAGISLTDIAQAMQTARKETQA